MYSAALTNVATCCLHIREYGEGIEKILEALAAMPSASSPVLLLARVFAEGTFTRLLLETGNVQEAAKRAQLAKGFAVNAKSVQADISAACSEGLVEVYSGLGDVGLSRGMQALERLDKSSHHYGKHSSLWCRHTRKPAVPSAPLPCIAS